MLGDHFSIKTSKIKALLEVFTIIKRDKKVCPLIVSPDGVRAVLNDDKSTCLHVYLNRLFFDSFEYQPNKKPVLFGVQTKIWQEVFQRARNCHIRMLEFHDNCTDHQIVTVGENKNGIKKENKIQVSEVPLQVLVPEGVRESLFGLEVPSKWLQNVMKEVSDNKWVTISFDGKTRTLNITGTDDQGEKAIQLQLSASQILQGSSLVDLDHYTASSTYDAKKLAVLGYSHKYISSFARIYLSNDKELLVKYLIEHHTQDPDPQHTSRLEIWIANKKKLINTHVDYSEELFASYRNEKPKPEVKRKRESNSKVKAKKKKNIEKKES